MNLKKNSIKMAIKILILVVCILFIFAKIIELKYSMTLVEYVKYSIPLTKSEKGYLKETEILFYGADKNAPPLSFINPHSGQNEGLVIDYMSSLSIELGINIECKPLVWHKVIDELGAGNIHMADLFRSEERKKTLDFSHDLYVLKGVVLVRSNRTDIANIEDLKYKTIAVPDGDYAEEMFLKKYNDKNLPKIIAVKDIQEAVQLLIDEEVDAVAGDESVIAYFIKNSDLSPETKILDEALYQNGVTLAVNKEDDRLLNILNKGILRLKKKNILVQIQQKWFGTSAPIIKDVNTYEWMGMGLAASIVLGILLYLWNAIMLKKIREKTSELELNKANLRTIIDAISSYLMVVDLNSKIKECNMASLELLKTTRESVLETHVHKLPILGQIYKTYKEGNQSVQKIGEQFYNIDARKFNSAEGLCTLIIIENITDKIISERKVRQEGKMIAVGQLSAGLAHEIRNPLGLIKNYKYVLKAYATDEISSHALNVIDDSVNRINSLIENLLSFSKLGGESKEKVSICTVISSILQLEKKLLEQAKIEVLLQCSQNLYFHGSEETLKIILFNLINNAIEALKEIVKDKDQEKYLKIFVEKKKEEINIIISDNGKGISEECMELIFNPFYTTKATGTGLGLYIVNFELEKINGSINVKSEQNKGTTFELSIPIT